MALLAPPGRLVVEVDMDKKNWHMLRTGQRLRLERNWNNLNMRHVNPVNAIVLAGDAIDSGSEILVHHNSTQKTWEIHNFISLSGEKVASAIKYFSIPSDMAYGWFDGKSWQPCPGYSFGLRVYEHYGGILLGVPSKLIPDTLFVTTGEYAGQIVQTLKASDYTIIFQGREDREETRIRFRHWFDNRKHEREEVIGLRRDLTEAFQEGKLYIGESSTKNMSFYDYDRRKNEGNLFLPAG